jgi:hypothetical protein
MENNDLQIILYYGNNQQFAVIVPFHIKQESLILRHVENKTMILPHSLSTHVTPRSLFKLQEFCDIKDCVTSSSSFFGAMGIFGQPFLSEFCQMVHYLGFTKLRDQTIQALKKEEFVT